MARAIRQLISLRSLVECTSSSFGNSWLTPRTTDVAAAVVWQCLNLERALSSSAAVSTRCRQASRFSGCCCNDQLSFQSYHTGRPAQADDRPEAKAATRAGLTQGSWLLQRCPTSLLPYLQLIRLDKPIGTWLLVWPCFWSVSLASPAGSWPDARLLALFGAGALLLRGAGCTINDLWDRKLDAQVERTRLRPLAAGTITPASAIGALGVQLLAGLSILVQLNPFSQALGAASLGLVVTYPLMKRFTFWPQAFLGLTFNWGALLGWSAVTGGCAVPPIFLYASGVCWTLVYDTIYAHQDKADDAVVGIKSTALLFGDRTKQWLTAFACSQTLLLAATGLAAEAGPIFYIGVSATAAHLAWQIATVQLDCRRDCLAKFESNKWLGAVLFAAIVGDHFAGLGAVADG